MISLNGYLLSLFQRCRRMYAIQTQWRYLPWRPTTLFTACLRQAILALSNSPNSLQSVITSAVNQFTSNCKTPGLDVPYGLDTYKLATDYVSCLRTILTHLSLTKIPALHVPTPAELSSSLSWSFLSLSDPSHCLHRFEFPDYINDSTRARSGHSWELFGDSVFNLPHAFTLHLISIGRRETLSPHLNTPWCRAYKDSTINQFRFQKKSGAPLNSSWTPMYFARDNDPEIWVNKMAGDEIIPELVRTYSIPPADPIHIENFKRDLDYEVGQIRAVESKLFTELPIARPVCDSPYSCQHQRVCYSKDPLKEIESCGLYEQLNVHTKLGRPSTKI